MLHATWAISNLGFLDLKHKLSVGMRIDKVDSPSQNPSLVISGPTCGFKLTLGLRFEPDQQSNNNY